MRNIDKYSDEEFSILVNKSVSMSDVAYAIGYSGTSNHSVSLVKKRMESLGLSICDSARYEYLRTPEDELYVRGKLRAGMRKRVFKDAFMPYVCSMCGNNGEWCGKPLTLQLDHIDGDATNNEKPNLRWLCPNCHTQTETYGNKNKNSKRGYKIKEEALCISCGKSFFKKDRTQKLCSIKCSNDLKRKELPVKKSELKAELFEGSFESVGRKYGVSGNAVRKWCIKYGLPDRSSYYKK